MTEPTREYEWNPASVLFGGLPPGDSFHNYEVEPPRPTPQQELLFRLNAQLLGEDPGQPVNWRGLP